MNDRFSAKLNKKKKKKDSRGSFGGSVGLREAQHYFFGPICYLMHKGLLDVYTNSHRTG